MAPPAHGSPRFPLLAKVYPPAAGLLLVALLVALDQRPMRSFDTYFHLRFGEEFLHDWSISHPGQPSAASSNDWVPTQWLPQMALALIDDDFGTTGLVLTFAVLVVAFAAATYLLLRSRAGSGAAVSLTVVVVLACLPSLSLRPQVLSYVFLVLVLAAWERTRRTGRVPWALIPLGWLWATCHGMWVIGVLASALLASLAIAERRPARGRAMALLAVPLGMGLVALATPVGPRLLSAVLLVNSRSTYFSEWAAPSLLAPVALPLTLLAAIAVLLLFRNAGMRLYDLGLLAMGAAFALYSGRTVPLAAVTLAAAIAGALASRPATGDRPAVSRRELAIVCALGAVVVALAPTRALVDDPADRVRPFLGQLSALPAGSRVVTDWPTGGVLLRLEPRLDVPLHGYGDVYTDEELKRYADLAGLEPGWDRTLARLHPDAALMADDDRLAYALERDGWTVEQRTEHLVLLTPPVG